MSRRSKSSFLDILACSDKIQKNKTVVIYNQNITDNDGIPLIHQAILRQSNEAALFLLNQNVDINAKLYE